MRYLLAVLMLLPVLQRMKALAAPLPPPFAILAIGSPPDPKASEEEYRKNQREAQTHVTILSRVTANPEIRKLPSIASKKVAYLWLAENLRVIPEDRGRHLRMKFRAGSRVEQVTILNAVLRANLAACEERIKRGEEWICKFENNILELEKRIKSAQTPQELASLQKAICYLRTKQIPEFRAAIARHKQIAVIQWAK